MHGGLGLCLLPDCLGPRGERDFAKAAGRQLQFSAKEMKPVTRESGSQVSTRHEFGDDMEHKGRISRTTLHETQAMMQI